MIKSATPNRVILIAVVLFIAYPIAAMAVPPLVLRDVFNSLAFGTSLIITLTWASSALRAVRQNAESGEWLLVLAIFFLWLIALVQRLYAITFNWYGRPDAWALSAIAGFFPYCYTVAGLLFLASPGVKQEGFELRAWWTMIAAVAIGSLVAGILIGAAISTG